jgi:hypothetical protein
MTVTLDLLRDPFAPSGYAIHSVLDGLDQVALAMERKWGIGRLRLLVSDLLRAKFDAQKDRLDAAIESDREAYVRVQAEAMKRAWVALDRAATEAGHKALAPEVWECALPSSGEVVSIVRTKAEAHHVARSGQVWTIAEIALLIERLGETVAATKRTSPGAAVTAIRNAKPPIDWAKGDPIPF